MLMHAVLVIIGEHHLLLALRYQPVGGQRIPVVY